MSLNANKSVRCDWCGRLTKDAAGQYRRGDGSYGEILNAASYYEIQNATPDQDCCTDCYATITPAGK